MNHERVTVVVPVYGDWQSLRDCIVSLKKHIDTKRHKVMLVNDCGPEVDLLENNIKQSINGHKNFGYFRNPKNLGFVKTCNRAVMELDKTDNDILLQTSDTKVTPGFLEEMQAVMYSDSKIGVVSPRSNNANICTIPLAAFIGKKDIKSGKSYKIFQIYKSKLPRYNVAPTAHGFCMLIRRSVIKKYGLFDEIFGRGYAEENDFCMRIKHYGYTSVIANRSYVFHLEAKSFTLGVKAELVSHNRKIIDERYPEYKPAITRFIEDTLIREKKLMGKDAGLESPYNLNRATVSLKRVIRRNPTIYKLARRIRTALRN